MRGRIRTVEIASLIILILIFPMSFAGKCENDFSYPRVVDFHAHDGRFKMVFEHDGKWGCGGDRIIFVKDSNGNIIEDFFPHDDTGRKYVVEGEAAGDFVYVELMRDGITRRSRMFPVRYVDVWSLVGDLYVNGKLKCSDCALSGGDVGMVEIAGSDVAFRPGNRRGGTLGFFLHSDRDVEIPCERPVVFDISGGRMFVASVVGKGDYIIYSGNENCAVPSIHEGTVVVKGKAVLNASMATSSVPCMGVCAFSYSYLSPMSHGLLKDGSDVVMIDTSYQGTCREPTEPMECSYRFRK